MTLDIGSSSIKEETSIQRGDDEVAYFLRGDEDSWQHLVLKRLEYSECPKHGCHYHQADYRRLFYHFRSEHYSMEEKYHNKYENFCYRILQELAVWAINKAGRKTVKQTSKCLVAHNLIKHLSISLTDTTLLLHIETSRVAELSFQGKIICGVC